jgi:hypothetical protein
MSYEELEGLSKADLKNKLSQMGMSLDRIDHPRDYYAKLYIEKSNAKNKITRDNTPFYRNEMLRGKRERAKEKETDKEIMDDPNYEEEEYEEEEEIIDENDEDYVYEESEDIKEKGKNNLKRKTRKREKIDEKNNDYRESGIKITRLVRIKNKKNPKTKKFVVKMENNQGKRKILNNYNDLAGRNNEYDNKNDENYYVGEKSKNQNMNIGQDYNRTNNEFNSFENS